METEVVFLLIKILSGDVFCWSLKKVGKLRLLQVSLPNLLIVLICFPFGFIQGSSDSGCLAFAGLL